MPATQNDALFHRLSDAIQQIYANADELDTRRHGLASVAALLDTRHAIIFGVPLDGDGGRVIAQVGVSEFVASTLVAERRIDGNPLAEPRKWAPGWVYLGCEFDATAGWRSSAFVREFCQPNRIRDILLGIIDTNSAETLGVAFLRENDEPGFGDVERGRLTSILPHWRNAFAFRNQLDQLSARANAAHGILDQAPFAILLLDAEAEVRYSNAWARKICDRDDGIGIRNGRLRIPDAKGHAELKSALRRLFGPTSTAHGGQCVFPIVRPSGKADYQFAATTMLVTRDEVNRPPRKVAVAFLLDPAARAPLQGNALRSLHGLTDAESRVCELMYQSKSIADTASELNISVNTAKTHLAHIFRKMGINSQNELMDYLARLPKLPTRQDVDRPDRTAARAAATSAKR